MKWLFASKVRDHADFRVEITDKFNHLEISEALHSSPEIRFDPKLANDKVQHQA
ncbi:MAG: hypothetical protein R8G66_05230 [Cytophagales bacterium]|nr:hypothetical protein [Cytophagales bacterium]